MFSYLFRNHSRYRLTGDRIYIRPPGRRDEKAWRRIREESRDFLRPWEPRWGVYATSRRAFYFRLKRFQKDWDAGRGHGFFIFNRQDDRLLGGITMANIRYGVVQAANIGYWMGAPYIRKGYMQEAVQLILDFAFHRLELHRVEAACLVHNLASRKLLEKCGFQEEGLAREYLCINGRWQDHVCYAILDKDPRPVFLSGRKS